MSRAVIYEQYGGPKSCNCETFQSRTPGQVKSGYESQRSV
jgi:hypothetical protein